MFHSIAANFRYNSGWTIEKRTQSIDNGGEVYNTTTSYSGVYLQFFADHDNRIRSNDGNWIDVDGGAWLSWRTVSGLGIEIDAHDTYLSGIEGKYKILSVIKDGRFPYRGYYLTLKGDSLNAY